MDDEKRERRGLGGWVVEEREVIDDELEIGRL